MKETILTAETAIPRAEHPNPQCERKHWENLNGMWDFALDFGARSMDRKFYENPIFTDKICVPFCVESELSGIGCKDFVPCCWYRRFFDITKEQQKGTIYLHFDAVDYEAHIFINRKEVTVHRGGFASFRVDITSYVTEGENEVMVCVCDDIHSGNQPGGKQSRRFHSYGCYYTRTTGIWQTVWLEFVPKAHITNFRFYPNVSEATLTILAEVIGKGTLSAEAFFEGRSCGSAKVNCMHGQAALTLQLTETHLWELGEGNLYDLVLKFEEDTVNSYFGLREVKMDGYRFLLNGKSVFQRLVLDQGFYPDGIWTAPTAAALEKDIRLSMELGFNGARLHQKVFEPRFLYYCDKHGYMVWGENGNWGLDISKHSAFESFIPEWMEILKRDFNHPSIVGWCPFNETWDRNQIANVVEQSYRMTKLYDTTRPCIDTSGGFHTVTDIYDLHDYEQDPEILKANYDTVGADTMREPFPDREKYTEGLPFFLSEYGGIKWNPQEEAGAWGYGQGPKTEEEFIERYKGLTWALLDNPKIMGFCYTQLTDVEQECNGLYYYDRTPKFESSILHDITVKKAAIEME